MAHHTHHHSQEQPDAESSGKGSIHEQFENLLNHFKDYAFITFNTQYEVTHWNSGAQLIFGYSAQEMIGRSGNLLFTPEDVAKGEDKKELQDAADFGRALDERWHVRKDGSYFWGSGIMAPLRDAGGQLTGFSKVVRDETARKEANDHLRDSEERFRLLVENVTDYALIPVDPQGNVSGWNLGAERTFGYQAGEIVGKSARVFCTPEDVQAGQVEADFQRALQQGRSENERLMVRRNGERFWSWWVTTPMWDKQGNLRGFAKILHDETERKEAHEARERLHRLERERLQGEVQSTAEALDRTKDELRALAANLLTAHEDERRRLARELHDDLLQRLSLLEIELVQIRKRKSLTLRTVREDVYRLEQAVANLSDHVRQLSHQLHPAILDDLGLPVALEILLQEFQKGRTTPVTLTGEGVPEKIPASISTALYRITQEALRNISKHSGSVPVTVDLSGNAGALTLQIRDSGPGFDPAQVRGKGGLGIISMQERAQLIGASFSISSGPDQGTTLTMQVRIPEQSQ
jgi:PAS domain S-box-containing protein